MVYDRMNMLEWMDQHPRWNLHLIAFSLRSVLREYGRAFATCIIARHPFQSLRGIYRYLKASRHQLYNHTLIDIQSLSEQWKNCDTTIVGVGYCMKPLDPPCLSGRGNHNCHYLESNLHQTNTPCPVCCRNCSIREMGLQALAAGSRFYIMTSAHDILHDMLLPALKQREFTLGLFTLCRYSFEPFQIALDIVNLQGYLFPFESGDCRDYSTWLSADVGIKEEQTRMDVHHFTLIHEILIQSDASTDNPATFMKKGNVFYCR